MKAEASTQIAAPDTILRRILTSTSVFWTSFFTIVCFEWVCRLRLYAKIYEAARESMPILGFLPATASKLNLGTGFVKDAIVAAIAAAGIALVCAVIARIPGLRGTRLARILRNLIVIFSLLFISFVFGLQFSLISYLHTGITRRLLAYAMQDFAVGWYLSYVSPYDLLFFVLIVFIYYALVALPKRMRMTVRVLVLACCVISVVVSAFSYRESRHREQLQKEIFAGRTSGAVTTQVEPEIAGNPLAWTARRIFFGGGRGIHQSSKLPSLEQQQTAGFVDPAFASSPRTEGGDRHAARLENAQERWNVVFFLLESINVNYALGSSTQPSIMPFLKQLAAHGLVLENHFSGGVDTDYATFPIFTGIYPAPAAINFIDRKDLRLPTLFSMVGPCYDNIFVTESDTSVYYPIALLKNSGLKHVWDTNDLPTKSYHLFISTFKDPAETASFFASRINSMAEPFVAVYNLYATHSPYFDYERNASSVIRGNPKERFERNVGLVDDQMKFVVDQLIASGKADHTIFVITSDHGEAFGEHSNDFGHGLFLYNEPTQVPMVFYQPNLIKPGTISDVTSHVDILPTLLDMMGITYNPLQFQGESVLRELRRKYVFIYGPKDDAAASVSRDRIKVIESFGSQTCKAFDLKSDPDEQTPQDCAKYSTQVQDLLEYCNHQLHFLPALAASCKNGLPCGPITPYPK